MRLNRKNIYEINIWPGFVDILGTLLIVTIFTVLISTVTQIYFNDQLEIKRGEISSLDEELNSLIKQLEIEVTNQPARAIINSNSESIYGFLNSIE